MAIATELAASIEGNWIAPPPKDGGRIKQTGGIHREASEVAPVRKFEAWYI